MPYSATSTLQSPYDPGYQKRLTNSNAGIVATTAATAEQTDAIALENFDRVQVSIKTVQTSSSTDTVTHTLVVSNNGTDWVTPTATTFGANNVFTITTNGAAGTYNSLLYVNFNQTFALPRYIAVNSITSAGNGTKTAVADIVLSKANR
jgi:hypothetical protein